MENRRRQVNPEIRESVDLSFQIVDRIHEILTSKGLKQKDLALLLDKKEAEISKWMRGTHNALKDIMTQSAHFVFLQVCCFSSTQTDNTQLS